MDTWWQDLGHSVRVLARQPFSTGVAVVVLGHSYWSRRFASDPSVVGHPVQVNGHPCTIVGVVSPAFIGAAPFIEMDA